MFPNKQIELPDCESFAFARKHVSLLNRRFRKAAKEDTSCLIEACSTYHQSVQRWWGSFIKGKEGEFDTSSKNWLPKNKFRCKLLWLIMSFSDAITDVREPSGVALLMTHAIIFSVLRKSLICLTLFIQALICFAACCVARVRKLLEENKMKFWAIIADLEPMHDAAARDDVARYMNQDLNSHKPSDFRGLFCDGKDYKKAFQRYYSSSLLAAENYKDFKPHIKAIICAT